MRERGSRGERERERERRERKDNLHFDIIIFIQGYGGFTGFHLSMLISWLLRSKKINRLMSSYQILRIALQTISTGDWATHGISMAPAQEDEDQVCSKPQSSDIFSSLFGCVTPWWSTFLMIARFVTS